MRIRLHDWIEERNERTTVSDQHPVLTCSQDGILLQSAYFKKQIASQDNTGYKIVHRGDFTYRAMSDTGRFYIHQMDCTEIGIVSPAYPVFYLKEGAPIVPEYLLLFFESELFHELVASKSKGSTRLSLRLSKIADIVVDFPDVDEQNKRVALMNSLSQQIEDVSRREQSYGDTVKSLFNELTLNLKESTPLSSFANVGSSKRVHAGDYTNRGIPFYRSKEIRELGDGKKPSAELFISEKHYEEIKKKNYIPKEGDILIAAIGATIGYLWQVNTDTPFYYKDGNLICISAMRNINPVFLRYALLKAIQEFKEKGAAGTAQLALTIEKVETIPIPNVPIQKQNGFARRLEQIDKLRFNAVRQKELFTEYRSSFLQDFFEGGNKHE